MIKNYEICKETRKYDPKPGEKIEKSVNRNKSRNINVMTLVDKVFKTDLIDTQYIFTKVKENMDMMKRERKNI